MILSQLPSSWIPRKKGNWQSIKTWKVNWTIETYGKQNCLKQCCDLKYFTGEYYKQLNKIQKIADWIGYNICQ